MTKKELVNLECFYEKAKQVYSYFKEEQDKFQTILIEVKIKEGISYEK